MMMMIHDPDGLRRGLDAHSDLDAVRDLAHIIAIIVVIIVIITGDIYILFHK
jgi:hydroxyethylthiazole kinase-like sugar kinase family protein